MADKKISELPKINSISGSEVIIPIVHDGTTQRMDVSTFGVYASQYSATTGSNTFIGNQTITGNATIGGTLAVAGKITAQEFFTEITSASVIFESGSTIFGDSSDDTHTFTGTLILNGLAIGTAQLMAQTASQDEVNLRIASTTGSINTTTSSFNSVFLGISSVTGAINTTTSSFDSVFLGISSVTGAMNTQSSSQDLVNRQISLVSGSIHFTTGALNEFTASVIGQTNTISTFTSSINFATQSLNTQTGSQDSLNTSLGLITSSIYSEITSFNNVFSGVSNVTGAFAVEFGSIQNHILSQAVQTASQDLVNLGISTYTGSQNVINNSVDSHILKQATQTGSQDLVNLGLSTATGSLIAITNGLMAFTAALDSTYATDAQLYQLYQATSSIHSATQSLNTQTGSQDLVNRAISSTTGSINVTTSSFDLVFRGISSVTGAMNTQTGSQDLVNLGISSVTGSLIGITNGLMAFTAALDNTYATDAQLYQLYQATASIQFATASLNTQTGSQDTINFNISVVTSSIDSHILKQATQTGSQDLVNLSISTFTGSLRSEVNLIEAYTASLKGAAIVSSSQQITNYYKFAETASANTFYGNQSISGSVGVNKSSNGGSGNDFPRLKVQNSLPTQGDGSTTFNFADVMISSGNEAVTMFLSTTYAAGTWAPSAIINVSTNHGLQIKTNNTTALNIASGGDVTVSTGNLVMGTAGKGIDFSATSEGSGTMTSELLNDYEEGTWVIGIEFGGASTGVTTSTNTGTYTKIGRQVTVNGGISLTSKGSSTGAVEITGLPFTIGATASNHAPASIWLNNVTFANQYQARGLTSGVKVRIEEITEAGVLTNIDDTNFANNSEVFISLTYFV